jgi:hypothetical protein
VNRNSKGRYTCLIPDLKGKAFNRSLFNCGFVTSGFYCIKVQSFYIEVFFFLSWKDVKFFQMLFLYLLSAFTIFKLSNPNMRKVCSFWYELVR